MSYINKNGKRYAFKMIGLLRSQSLSVFKRGEQQSGIRDPDPTFWSKLLASNSEDLIFKDMYISQFLHLIATCKLNLQIYIYEL